MAATQPLQLRPYNNLNDIVILACNNPAPSATSLRYKLCCAIKPRDGEDAAITKEVVIFSDSDVILYKLRDFMRSLSSAPTTFANVNMWEKSEYTLMK